MSRSLTDLRLVVVLVVGAVLALLVPGVPWQVEWVFGLGLLLVAPGYAVVAALFPKRPGLSTGGAGAPGWPARFGLSLLGSAAVVAVVGVLFARQGLVRFSLAPAVLLIAGVTLLAVVVAAVRRTWVPVDRRADPLAAVSFGTAADSFGLTGAQSFVLLVSVVVLASALAFGGTSPVEDPYSEAYLTGGETVDVGPEQATLVAGADNTVALAIGNHEGEPTDYRVVVRLQRVGADGSVQAQERLDDFVVGLAANETRVVERSLDPSLTGDGLRFQVLVYKGGVDGDLGPGTADLSLRRWVNVTAEGSA